MHCAGKSSITTRKPKWSVSQTGRDFYSCLKETPFSFLNGRAFHLRFLCAVLSRPVSHRTDFEVIQITPVLLLALLSSVSRTLDLGIVI
jgi:hypothetical protein